MYSMKNSYPCYIIFPQGDFFLSYNGNSTQGLYSLLLGGGGFPTNLFPAWAG